MRRLSFFLCLLAVMVGVVLFMQEKDRQADALPAAAPTAAPEETQAKERMVVTILRPSLTPAASPAPTEPESVTLSVLTDDNRIEEMDMEAFLVHVVAGEMPASYEPEALKAQAVAARSYAAWKLPKNGGSGCTRAQGADVCTDSQHCMAYLTEEEMRKAWGDQYETYLNKITQAVQDTRGQVLTYNGSPIQALFHSASGGRTEDAQAVWGSAVPYLTSVTSQESADQKEKRFAVTELVSALNKAFEGAGLTSANVKTQFAVKSHTESGRADVVKVGKITATGRAVRAALDLNSANFTIAFDGSTCILTTIGSGHGVGMSQVGANQMAKAGIGYEEILLHYYTGTTIENEK